MARVHFDGPQFDLVTLLQLIIKVIQQLLVNELALKSRLILLKLEKVSRSDCFNFGRWGWGKQGLEKNNSFLVLRLHFSENCLENILLALQLFILLLDSSIVGNLKLRDLTFKSNFKLVIIILELLYHVQKHLTICFCLQFFISKACVEIVYCHLGDVRIIVLVQL